MNVFKANISHKISELLNKELNQISLFEAANDKIFNTFKMRYFFGSQYEYEHFKNAISQKNIIFNELDRTEYGDFQTNQQLANSVTLFLKNNMLNPKLVIEPTCGKGNFIIALLTSFYNIEKIVGVEIYKPYIWEIKFKILDFYIDNPTDKKPEIEIHHFNVFDFDFHSITKQFSKQEILIIGNPPWVTNAKLSSLKSNNLPQKSNFKKHNGLDAITGKGNFDIGEYITMMMFDAFQHINGHLAFLVKNSVIKNVVYDQKQHNYKISGLQKYTIDSKKEFNASVEASLFFCKLNSIPEYTCKEFRFYCTTKFVREFGWVDDKFVSNTEYYSHSKDIDDVCQFEWRQGIKHDLSLIMELERINEQFINGLNQKVNLEEDLIFGVLKSSDLKQPVISKTRKYTIVTQKKVGQDTTFIKQKFPQTYKYLQNNKSYFDKRKSSIYNNKPNFSIFGIGDYSFSPYKISISGLYKTFTFSLILPIQNKPVMLDDTCYLLGFDNIYFAAYTLVLLNSDKTKEFLQSITFSDAKRIFTKEILMRIDLYKLAIQFSKNTLQQEINILNNRYNLNIKDEKWEEYLQTLKPKPVAEQMKLFA